MKARFLVATAAVLAFGLSCAKSKSGLTGGGDSVDAASSSSAMCAESPCKLVSPQCGCPMGQACVVDGSGMRKCTPAGNAQIGDACSANNECVEGGVCLATVGAPTTCFEFCDNDNE